MTQDNPMPVYAIHPIGTVKAVDQTGHYGIQVLPAYRDGLAQLAQFSHVIILWWADQHDTPASRAQLTAKLPYAPAINAGVFACRSEYRPNPIAMTTMPILHIDSQTGFITLPWIDAFDGTPVLDLKPYLPVSDRIRDVGVADWMQGWPTWMEDAAAFFAEHQTDFGD